MNRTQRIVTATFVGWAATTISLAAAHAHTALTAIAAAATLANAIAMIITALPRTPHQ